MSGTVGGPVIGSRGTGVIGGKKFYRFTSGTSVLHIPESATMTVIEMALTHNRPARPVRQVV